MLAFLVLLIVFFGLFYFIMRMEVQYSVDEILFNRKTNIIKTFQSKDGKIPYEEFSFTDFTISNTASKLDDLYTDTLIYEATDQEFDEYRKLVTSFSNQGKEYRLEIVKAHLESDEIISTVLLSLALIFILMFIGFFLFTRYFANNIWKPFHATLTKLKAFEAEKPDPFTPEQTRIKEFKELNNGLTELTRRVQRTFISQKQFLENASHEMQTPLAIIQNQSELLITDKNLTEAQSEKIVRILDSTQRITKLNKALQLISKIENAQFIDTELCNLMEVIKRVLSYFDGQQENLNIAVDVTADETTVNANATLVEVLVTNLVKNAFLHNVPHGFVHIKLESNSLLITNPSESKSLPKEKLFQRFFKQGQSKESWGLGLAISKRICEVNNWELLYSAQSTTHTFTIQFNNAQK
jgi:signal transduction histidine kinase